MWSLACISIRRKGLKGYQYRDTLNMFGFPLHFGFQVFKSPTSAGVAYKLEKWVIIKTKNKVFEMFDVIQLNFQTGNA